MTATTKALKRTVGKPLTTASIKAMKAGQTLADGAINTGSGRLKIRKRQTKTDAVCEWQFIYWGGEKNKRVTILLNEKASRYSSIEKEGFLTIAQAREIARKLQQEVQAGRDPMLQRVLDKATTQKKQATAITNLEESKKKSLLALMEAYVESLKGKGKTKSAQDVQNLVKNHITLAHPTLADKPASEITPQDVSILLSSMVGPDVEKKIGRTATKIRSFMGSAFKLAIGAELDPMAPTTASGFKLNSNPALAVPVTKMAASYHKVGQRTLSEAELKCYLIRLAAIQSPQQRLALELQIYAGGQRIEQLLRLTHTDIDQETFTLYDPKGKRVHPRVHILPITPEIDQRLKLLKELSPLSLGETSGTLFRSTGDSKINATTLSKLVKGISDEMITNGETQLSFRGGDIRRTCETLMAGKLGISKDTRAQVLSHGIAGVQDVVYDKANYLAIKTVALRSWIDYLTQVQNG